MLGLTIRNDRHPAAYARLSWISIWIFLLTQFVACADPSRCDSCKEYEDGDSAGEAVQECECPDDRSSDGDIWDHDGDLDPHERDGDIEDGDWDADPERYEGEIHEVDSVIDGDTEVDRDCVDSDTELPVTSGYFNPGNFESIPFCSDLVHRYPGSWQMVHPQPFPYANMGILEIDGRSMAIGEGGVALWERDQHEDWRLLPPIQPDGLNTSGGAAFACVEGICAPAENINNESACAVIALNQDDCWRCVMGKTNPFQPEHTLFSASSEDESIITSSTRSGIQRQSATGFMHKERVICSNPRHCHIHQLVEGTRFGFGLGGPEQNVPALYTLRDGEWIETQHRGEFVNGYYVGAFPRPLIFNDAAYLFTQDYSDEFGLNFTYRLDLHSERFEPVRLSGARSTYGGRAAFGLGFLGGNDGWLTMLGSDGGVWADQILPGHVYQFNFFDNQLWAMGRGFVASFNLTQGWRILSPTPMDAPNSQAHYPNREIVAVAGVGLEHFFAILFTQPGEAGQPAQTDSGPPVMLLERLGCEVRRIPLSMFGMTDGAELVMEYVRKRGLLVLGQDRMVAVLEPTGEEFYYATLAFPQGEKVLAIEELSDGKFTVLVCSDFGTCRFRMLTFGVDSLCPGATELSGAPDQEPETENELGRPIVLRTSAPFRLNDTGRDVTVLEDPYVFSADGERGILWNHAQNSITVEPYPGAFTKAGSGIWLAASESDERTIISGFEGGFLVREGNGTYRWDSAQDAGLALPEIVEHDDCLFSSNLMTRCNSVDGWTRSLLLGSYDDSPFVRYHLDKLGEVLVRYGWEEQLLGRVSGAEEKPLVQCPPIDVTELADLGTCETSCSPQGSTPEPECTSHECRIDQTSFCLNDCREVTVSDFFMDRYEVTNAEYAACVADGACTPPSRSDLWEIESYFGNPVYDRYPVTYINHNQAANYCASVGKRLPTEAEWVLAAFGREGKSYPFEGLCPSGTVEGASTCAAYGMNHSGPIEVGNLAYDASPYGAENMAGNVAEWLADNWDPYDFFESAQAFSPTGPENGEWKVVRGGHWAGGSYDLIQRSSRDAFQPDYASMTIGFRCACSVNTE